MTISQFQQNLFLSERMKKVLLIFGANGSLGTGVTNVLSKKDFDKIFLFATSLNGEPKDKKIHTVQVKDLSKEENVIAAFSNLKPDKDTIFFLYSTIGGYWGGQALWENKLEDWDRVFSMNLTTNFLLAKHFSWLVKGSAGGSVCFTAAYTALIPEALKSVYGASKSALTHLIKTLAKEGTSINLSANAIAPYIIDTPANRKWMLNADFNKWIKPDEIGNLAYSLFSNFNFISGNVIVLKERFNI